MQRAGEKGFTLLEILIGLAVSSLIIAGLSLASKVINKGYAQESAAIELNGAVTSGLYVVGGDIARIERVADNPALPTRFLFAGLRDHMDFIVAERPGNKRAGLYWVRLAVRRFPGGAELVRTRAPFVRGAPPASLGDEVVLFSGPVGIDFSYRAPRAGLRSWADSWLAGNMLPAQVKLEIGDLRTGRLLVPVFVQTLAISAEADCAVAEAPGCSIKSDGRLGG